MKTFAVATTLLAASIAGCSSALPKDPVYSGEYFYNFEFSYITPDGRDEQWCTEGDMSAAILPATEPTGPWGFTDVVVRGKLGPPGRFGGLGVCERVLQVTEVVKVSNMRRANRAAP